MNDERLTIILGFTGGIPNGKPKTPSLFFVFPAPGRTGNQPAPNYSYIFIVSFDITPKLGGFVKMYGELDEWTRNYDGHLSYLLNDDLMLDVYGGWQGQEGYNEFFFSTGFSWRLVRRQRGK